MARKDVETSKFQLSIKKKKKGILRSAKIKKKQLKLKKKGDYKYGDRWP